MSMKKIAVSALKRIVAPSKTRISTLNNRCQHCGADLRPDQSSLHEIITNVICAGLLLGALIPIGRVTSKWAALRVHNAFRPPLWSESFDR